MPRVISASSHWGSLSKWIIRPNYFEQTIFGWKIRASKQRVNQTIRENNAGESRSNQASKRLESLRLHSACSVSIILKVKISSTVPIPGHCERVPESWTSSPLQTSGRLSSRIWEEKCDSSAKLVTCQTRWWLKDWKREPAFSSISSPTDGEISWVLMKFGVTCHMWMDDGRYFMSFAEKEPKKAGGKFMYGSIHVESCSSREPALLSPLPSLFCPSRRKSQCQLLHQTKFSRPFSKRHPPSVWEGREFCRANTRQRSSAHGRGHRPVARKFRIQFHSYTGLARKLSRFVAHGLFGGWNFQAPTLEAEGTLREGTETGHGPGVVKSVCWSLC